MSRLWYNMIDSTFSINSDLVPSDKKFLMLIKTKKKT